MQKRFIPPVLGLMGVSLGLNGACMLLAPDFWYQTLPGVTDTGPFNHHFVQDIGAAYLSAAAAFLLAIAYPHAGFPLLLTAFAFLGLHGLVHIADSVAGRISWHHLAKDATTVIVPAIITLFFAHGMRVSTQE